MRDAIGDTVNLAPFQWAQWFAYVREYRPDLILELGRANGNSTAALNEALHQLGSGRLVSFCLSQTWHRRTAGLLRSMVEADWFDSLDVRVGNALYEDFSTVVGAARRVLVIWDAHGFDVASLVLGGIMPLLADREHAVAMHDISDWRYRDASLRRYDGQPLWRGMEQAQAEGGHRRLCLGWAFTLVEQAISTIDFLTRNGGALQSADESLHEEIGRDPGRSGEMAHLLAPEDWSLTADWAYFSLNGLAPPYTFPRFSAPEIARDGAARREERAGEPLEIRATSTRGLLGIAVRRFRRQLLPW